MKNLVQLRHLRRVCGRLIVSLIPENDGREENQKEELEEDQKSEEGRKVLKRSVGRKRRRRNGISNRWFPPTFIPPLTLSRFKLICPGKWAFFSRNCGENGPIPTVHLHFTAV